MEMGIIVPRAGIEPTSMAFRASVLPLHHTGSVMSQLNPHPAVLKRLFASEVSADCYTRPARIVSLLTLTITCIQSMTLHGRLNNETANSLYRIMVIAPSVLGVMKMGNTVQVCRYYTT